MALRTDVADGGMHLGRLARRMRLLGFDVTYRNAAMGGGVLIASDAVFSFFASASAASTVLRVSRRRRPQ